MKKYALFIAIALTLIACIYAYFRFLKPLDVFLWDESHHGFYGMQIYNDLKAGDWGLFWAHTNSQALWMPLHSWLDGIFLYIFGFSYAAARASSLFLFFWCSIIIFLIGLEMSKGKGWLIGLIAVCFYLTSPILLHLATVNMQEMLGIFVLLCLFYFMVRYQAVEAAWKYLIIGLLISIAYWSKSNFALQLILGVGLFQLSLLWKMKSAAPLTETAKEKKYFKKQPKIASPKNIYYAWLINNLLIIAGFLPLFVLWWATPPFERKYGLGFTIRTQGVGEALFYPSVNFFGRVIFYLQSLISSYTFSFWLGLGFLAALGISFYFFEDKKIRLALLMFLSNLFMVSIVGNIQERYISTAAPLVFLLFAYLIVVYADKLKDFKKAAVPIFIIIVLIAVTVIYDASSLTRYTKEVANRSILFFIYKDSLNRFSPPFLFGLVKRPAFTYPMEQTKKYDDFKIPPKSSIQDVLMFFSSNIDRKKSISTLISFAELSPYVIYWHFHGWEAPVYSVNDWPIVNRYFWFSDYFLDLQVSPGSPYSASADWLEKRWNEIGPVLLKGGYIRLVASKEFADLGLTANIYKREKAI